MKKVVVLFSLLLVSLAVRAVDEHMYVYKNGSIVYLTSVAEVDSVSYQNDTIRVFDVHGALLQTIAESNVDSITFHYDAPCADVLDVQFQHDGTAVDASPMKNAIETINCNGMSLYPYSINGHYGVKFDNLKGSAPKSYYKIDYENNEAFKAALADGHTVEAVFMMTETPYSTSSSESKFFSSHQGGGTGFSINKTKICFFPNVTQTSSSHYIELYSDVTPQENVFYHVVGVWDKEKGIASLYINGELKATLKAEGNLKFPSSGAQWFGIGADAKNATSGEMSWNGDVRMARIYDKPLTDNDVTILWNAYQEEGKNSPDLVSDVEYFTGLPVKRGQTYEFIGKGFTSSDIIKFVPVTVNSKTYVRKVNVLGTDTAQVTIPTDFVSGVYQVQLIRGGKSQLLGYDSLVVVNKFPKPFEANFHRGFWNTPGSAQNSRTSLRKAIERNAFNSEIDIWLTSDDSLMVNHDATLNGVTVQTSTFEQVKDLKLVNGETIPQFRELLEILASSKGTRLVIETKKHSQTSRTIEASRKAMAMVEAMGLTDRVEYVSFSWETCLDQHAHDPNAIVSYINGDKKPQQLADNGLNMDYKIDKYRANPTWIKEAHDLGLMVTSWTLNTRADIIESANMEADVLASDYPWWSQKIREYYVRHQEK